MPKKIFVALLWYYKRCSMFVIFMEIHGAVCYDSRSRHQIRFSCGFDAPLVPAEMAIESDEFHAQDV